MASPHIGDTLDLWWLVDPARPRRVGSLRQQRRPGQPGGVALEYAASWLADGLALSDDLPLRPGEFLPTDADGAAGAVDDARPERWGERIIRLIDRPARLSTLDTLYFAGDARFGALGVSVSSSAYRPRLHGPMPGLADLPAMLAMVRRIEDGEPVDAPLHRLLTPGAGLGGTRPKALLHIDGASWIVKFAEAGDPLDSPLIEHATMTLASRAGIEACETRALRVADGHALAIRRFDRDGPRRRHALSAHVALRAAGEPCGYPELALLLRRRGDADAVEAQGEQLFRRMIFNILVDNTDDHEKNHVLLAGEQQHYRLAPAFDVLPAAQGLGYQQLRVGRDGAESTLDNALSEHRAFMLTAARAKAVCAEVAEVVGGWRTHFLAAGVSPGDIGWLEQTIDRPFLRTQRLKR
ncbi:type II toxin-antitoxin system HipA family toxin [Aquincola sp. S2]|uniref:Type II toxin-antitoxin system HipA family toxin n=1 Tax=Pseudaquabacterium terrae TaxID=2732868 RepID=A0ABX2EA75_9BURK|nr:HipA domain-containing protein [Aquabacterium terrae]NRF65961.1 type II toxin-antitoxin system HipA family toxin [Aquabacterium terrae]